MLVVKNSRMGGPTSSANAALPHGFWSPSDARILFRGPRDGAGLRRMVSAPYIIPETHRPKSRLGAVLKIFFRTRRSSCENLHEDERHLHGCGVWSPCGGRPTLPPRHWVRTRSDYEGVTSYYTRIALAKIAFGRPPRQKSSGRRLEVAGSRYLRGLNPSRSYLVCLVPGSHAGRNYRFEVEV